MDLYHYRVCMCRATLLPSKHEMLIRCRFNIFNVEQSSQTVPYSDHAGVDLAIKGTCPGLKSSKNR